MMRIFYILLFLIHALKFQAQVPSWWLLRNDKIWKESALVVGGGANGSWGSNTLNNEWLMDMTLGGRITDSEKLRISKSMIDYNRVGGALNFGGEIYNFSDNIFGAAHIGLMAAVEEKRQFNMSFSKDLFDLIYFGNFNRQGDTMSLGPINASYQSYQKIGFGFFDKRTFSALKISVVNGREMQSLDVRRADFFTPVAGSSDPLTLRYEGEYWRADTSRAGNDGKGIGVCLDADFNIPFKEDKGFITVSLRDVGWVYWNNQTQHYRFDTTFSWSGIVINDFLGLDSLDLGIPNWQDTLGIERQKLNRNWMPLPSVITLRMLRKVNERNAYEASMMIQPNLSSIPYLMLGWNHFVAPDLLLSERVTYGGYRGLGIGLEMQWLLNDRFFLRAGSNHLFAFQNRAKGADLFIGMNYQLTRKNTYRNE